MVEVSRAGWAMRHKAGLAAQRQNMFVQTTAEHGRVQHKG
jgi:hypothetical protein